MNVGRSGLIKVQRIPEAGRSAGRLGEMQRCGVQFRCSGRLPEVQRGFQSAGLGSVKRQEGGEGLQAKVQGERKPMAGRGAWQDAGGKL